MSKIAITGGIGSGKSFVCSLLKERGIDVYDCDSAAKRIIAVSEEVRSRLTGLIGSGAYTEDGKLNKVVVSDFLLASEHNAKAINDIVHPAVADDFIKSGCQWMECAILYESGFDRLVDKVVVVTAPENVRIERIICRDGITEAKAKEWIARQMSQNIVRQKADFEIVNDGRQNVECQINNLINNLF